MSLLSMSSLVGFRSLQPKSLSSRSRLPEAIARHKCLEWLAVKSQEQRFLMLFGRIMLHHLASSSSISASSQLRFCAKFVMLLVQQMMQSRNLPILAIPMVSRSLVCDTIAWAPRCLHLFPLTSSHSRCMLESNL